MLSGSDGLVRLIAESGADLVLNAIVGSAGLGPTVALSEGMDLALANKESLVVGGELVTALAEATGSTLLPVDSEHTAMHHLLAGEPAGALERLVVTASGGPFRGRSRSELEDVTVEQALRHPTVVDGREDHDRLRDADEQGARGHRGHHLSARRTIDVVVHPQSIVHALVQLCDGSTLPHMGHPDMRVAIGYALHHPDRATLPLEPLDLVALTQLTFEAPDPQAFPCLELARQAAREGGTAPCVLNAANEVAVHAFLATGLTSAYEPKSPPTLPGARCGNPKDCFASRQVYDVAKSATTSP